VAVNKMDLIDVQDKWEEIKRKLKKKGIAPMAVSAATGLNLKELLYKAHEALLTAPIQTQEAELPVYQIKFDPHQYEIKKISNGWQVSGASIERAAAMTYWDNDASIRRFQRILEAMGVDVALREAGVKEGDMVSIGEYELEWSD
jgi:GTP-binding protein